jgi:integrase/recombinase XerD
MLVDNSFVRYLKYEMNLSSNTIQAYNHDVGLFFRVIDKNYLDLTVKDIINFMIYLRENNYSIDSINRILSGLSTYFDYLIFENKLLRNPIDFIDRPKNWGRLPKLLDFQEVEALINAPVETTKKGFRDKIIIEMLYSSGARVSEISNMKVSDVDLDRGVVKIYGKGSKHRYAPIYESLLFRLKKYMDIRKGIFVKGRDEGFLFLNKYGRKLSRISIWHIIKHYCSVAHIEKNVSPHTIRHSFATHLLTNGADLRTIQIFLGHSNINTTEIYTHLNDDNLRKTLLMNHPRFNIKRDNL